MSIRKLLIANRGEIARRIIRSCRRMGIATVAVYSDADRHMPFVDEADEAYALEGNTAAQTYLNAEKLLQIALRAQVDAIHPGYGFLSENAAFVRQVYNYSQQRQAQGGKPLYFIGPHADAIEQMGSKSNAKALMEAHGVPTVPGYRGRQASLEEMQAAAHELGFPVLLKAAAGGGGKGMRIVYQAAQFVEAFQAAQREALHAFGDDELLLEKYFASARHIEFQILGDKHGNVLHLFERECSIQRRYQKIIEESPSPALSSADRQAMAEAALRAARALHYDNAGTVEFIYVGEGEFYFLEVNTRLQVEHPVTEAITGLDLVEWQIRIAAGEPLPFCQADLRQEGYAIEARLYAEEPEHDFRPSTGRILYWRVPSLPGLRVDSGIETGSYISPYYDPMIAKIIVHAQHRQQAIQQLAYALSQLACLGVNHNGAFLQRLCHDEHFLQGKYDTHFLQQRTDLLQALALPAAMRRAWLVGITLWQLSQQQKRYYLPTLPPNWRNTPQQSLPYGWLWDNELFTVECSTNDGIHFSCRCGSWQANARIEDCQPHYITYECDTERRQLYIFPSESDNEQFWLWQAGVGSYQVKRLPRFPDIEISDQAGSYKAQMPGQITRIMVKPGDSVVPGQTLLVFVSMKMENRIEATEEGIVQAVYVNEGDTVEAGVQLIHIQALEKTETNPSS